MCVMAELFQNEYVSMWDKRHEFVSAFSGSAVDFCFTFCCFICPYELVWLCFYSSVSKPSDCLFALAV